MVDAYECQSCGTVMARPRNCPSCGGREMRPTRAPESELGGDGETARDDETGASSASETEATGETEHAESQRRGDTRSGTENSGLLAWLKSLF